MVPFVRSWFLDRTHYNEFVESGFGSWALIRQRFVLRGKNAQDWTAQDPREKGPLARGLESPTPLASRGPLSFSSASFFPLPLFVRSLLLYILLLHSSSSYTYRSSMPIFECTSHRALFLALCKLLWPPSHCPGVTSTSMGLGC